MIDQWSCNDLDDDHHRPPHLQPPWITIQYLWKSLPPPYTSPQRRKWNIDPDNLICTLFMRSDFSLSPKVGKLLSNLYQSIWFYNQKQCSYNKSECEMRWLVYINFLSFSVQQENPIPFECGAVAVNSERLPGPDRDPQRGAGRPPGHQGRVGDGAGCHAHGYRGPLGVHQHREGMKLIWGMACDRSHTIQCYTNVSIWGAIFFQNKYLRVSVF